MTDERQAVKTLAEQLVKAMKSVSANTPSKNYTNGTTPSTISASKIVGLPAAFSSIINGVEDAAAGGDAVAQQMLVALQNIANGNFNTITVDTAMVERLYATFGKFINLVAKNATIGDLDVETIRAGMGVIGLLTLSTADIEQAQIDHLSAENAFIRYGTGGKLYIDDLAVSNANIVNLAAGTILLNNSDGELVELYVDATTGDITTRTVSYDGSDIINQNSLSGNTIINNTLSGDAVVANSLNGNKIVSGSITTTQLNASEIFAAQGTIMDLIADNINATRLFANQGFIPQLETTIINSASIGNSIDLSANSSITLLQDSINLLSSNTSRTFVQGSSPFPVHLSDTWFDPATEDHYVAAGIVIPNQQMTFGHDDAGNLSNVYTEDYEFAINSDGELMVLIENEDLEDIVVENNIDFSIKEGGYLFVSGLWNKIKNVAFSNLRVSVDGIISEVYDSEKGSSRIEQNADRIIAIVSGSQSVPFVKTNSIEIKEDLIEIKSSGNVDIKADNFSVSFNTEGSLPSRSRVDINNDVGIRVSDRYGGYFQANYNKIGLYDMLDTPRLYMDANGQAFFNGSLTLGGVRNTDGSLTIRNEDGAIVLFANKNGMEIYDATGNTRQFYLDSSTGNATFAGTLNAAGGTFAGELSAATGTFAGELSAACITSGTLNSDRIAAKSLSVDKITGNIETGDWGIDFTNGSIKIGSITVETLEASKITGSKTLGDWGIDFTNGSMTIGSIAASKITGSKTLGDWGIDFTNGSMSIGTITVDKISGSKTLGDWAINFSTGSLTIGDIAVSKITGSKTLGNDWSIDFSNGTMNVGAIAVGKITGNIPSTSGGWSVDFSTGELIIGDINATTGSFSGALNAATGTFKGGIEISSGQSNMGATTKIDSNYFEIKHGTPTHPLYVYIGLNRRKSTQINTDAIAICDNKILESGEYFTLINRTGIVTYEKNNNTWVQCMSVDAVYGFSTTHVKNRIVSTSQYFNRLLYCYETTSPMFGDVGEGVISPDGQCYIPLDPIFAQTISTDQYQVFLQRYGEGDCYVSERHGSYFVVAGTPNLSFGWEIKAKQSDFDQLRLERNDEKFSIPDQTYGEDAAAHIQELYNERTQQDTQQYNQESEE